MTPGTGSSGTTSSKNANHASWQRRRTWSKPRWCIPASRMPDGRSARASKSSSAMTSRCTKTTAQPIRAVDLRSLTTAQPTRAVDLRSLRSLTTAQRSW
jgi:hypothetical protein